MNAYDENNISLKENICHLISIDIMLRYSIFESQSRLLFEIHVYTNYKLTLNMLQSDQNSKSNVEKKQTIKKFLI